jgi:uncharacterized membrane protein SpoIIM required for sporulation
MRETNFVRQNKEKWLQSEHIIKGDEKDPEKLSSLFVQVVDDLSYSQTFYRFRSVRVYLNTLARDFFSIIYDSKKEKKNYFKEFWLDELPQIIIFCRKEMLISLLVFLMAAAIGVFSSANDKEFTATILGDDYVAATKENIAKGDPMAVYKKANQADMFLSITTNNIMVAVRTYVFGIFFSLGTIAILLFNGVMVGTFQYFFAEHNLLFTSSTTIWLHGTLEISAIIIAGGAGITLGNGFLFPGTYSRLQAFQMSAVRSLKLMFGIAPVIITAGLIESFITRYTEVPTFVKLLLIFLSAAFIIGYFVLYPWWKSKVGFKHPLVESKLQPTSIKKIDFNRIKNNADIISDSFGFFKRNFNLLIRWILPLSLGCTVLYVVLNPEREQSWGNNEILQFVMNDMFFALSLPTPIMVMAGALATSIIFYKVYVTLLSESGEKLNYQKHLAGWLMNFLAVALIYFFLYWTEWGVWLLIFTFGIVALLMFGLFSKRINQLWNLLSTGFAQIMGLQFILFLTVFVFLLILTSPVLYTYTEIVTWSFEQDSWITSVVLFIETFIKFLAFYLLLPIIAGSIGLLYFSLVEVTTATTLKSTIAQINSKRLKRGFENED